MRDALFAIYRGTGLSAIDSPWIASLVLFTLLAVAMYVLARLVVWSRTSPPSNRVIRVIAWLGLMAWLAFCMLTAVGIESIIRFDNGLQDDTWFSLYWLTLFLLANAPFWFVLWRERLLSHAKA